MMKEFRHEKDALGNTFRDFGGSLPGFYTFSNDIYGPSKSGISKKSLSKAIKMTPE